MGQEESKPAPQGLKKVVFRGQVTDPSVKYIFVGKDDVEHIHRLKTSWKLQVSPDDSFLFVTRISAHITTRSVSHEAVEVMSTSHKSAPREEPIQEISYFGNAKSAKVIGYKSSERPPKTQQDITSALLNLLPNEPLDDKKGGPVSADESRSAFKVLQSLQVQTYERHLAKKKGLNALTTLSPVAVEFHAQRVEYKLKRPSRAVPREFFSVLVKNISSPPISPSGQRTLDAGSPADSGSGPINSTSHSALSVDVEPDDTPMVKEEEVKEITSEPFPADAPRATGAESPERSESPSAAGLMSPHASRGTGPSPVAALFSPHVSRGTQGKQPWDGDKKQDRDDTIDRDVTPQKPTAQPRLLPSSLGSNNNLNPPSPVAPGGRERRASELWNQTWDLDGLVDEAPPVHSERSKLTADQAKIADFIQKHEDVKEALSNVHTVVPRPGPKEVSTDPDFFVSAGSLNMYAHVDASAQSMSIALAPLQFVLDTGEVADPKKVEVNHKDRTVVRLQNQLK